MHSLPGMRVAIAAHDDRVSPVFDVARRLIVVDAEDSQTAVRSELPLDGTSLPARVRELQTAGVHVLICGAISRPLEAALIAAGIQVIPQICGPTDDVLTAFFSKQLSGERYLMPGCCGKRRGQCHGQGTSDTSKPRRGMNRRGAQSGPGAGRGCGFGRGGRRSGGKGKTDAP